MHPTDSGVAHAVREEVRQLAASFPLYTTTVNVTTP